MRVLAWHVHGSWMTSFVQGPHDYLVPVLPDRGPDGRGRARTFDWPASVREVTPAALADEPIDVMVLQRPQEVELATRWTGRRPGHDVPAVYVEHNTPRDDVTGWRHPLAGQSAIPLVHVTAFNAAMWDNGRAPTRVIEHGVLDPGPRWTGERETLAVVVNEPVRRWRVAGTDLVLRMAAEVGVEVYGMGMAALVERAPQLAGRVHEDLPQHELHARIGRHRAYFHPYRWTSLGLSLIEAMTAGLPVLCLSTTEAPDAVPAEAGVVSNDLTRLARAARRWTAVAEEAREAGLAARRYALGRFGLGRFLDDWDALLKEVTR
jgi:glycosyltransferase involved in cell wall biosynthesis